MDAAAGAGEQNSRYPAQSLTLAEYNSGAPFNTSSACPCGENRVEHAGSRMYGAGVQVLLFLLRLYQMTKPFRPAVCRFYPSCSQYSIDAIRKYGALSGMWMAVKRLSKCHPFHEGGYDPVL